MPVKIILASVIATLCATAGAAQTGPAQGAVPAATAPATADPDKKICRREQALGSFLAKSVCHTRREWAAIDGVNASDTENVLARRRVGMPGRDRN